MENKNDLLKNDILVLIMDFLYSNDLIDSLITIEKETKQSIFSYNKELLFLRKLIIQGNWDEAQNFLLPLKSNSLFNYSSAIYNIQLQKFFEAIETKSINYNQNEIELQLNNIHKYSTEEEFKELLNLFKKNSIREEEKYKNWSINRGRLKTFEIIRKLLEIIYPMDKEKEKNIKDNLLFEFFLKIIGNENLQKNKLINEIILIMNGKNISGIQKIKSKNNILEINKKNEENNNKKNKKNKQNIEELNNLNNINKNNIKEKQNEKMRPQSGIRNKKTEIDASNKFEKKRNNLNYNNNDLNKEKIKDKNINNDNINPINNGNNKMNYINDNINNFENTNISNIPNITENSSLIKDTKKIITNLSERIPKIKNINKTIPLEDKTIISQNIIHHKIESPYDLYSYDPSSYSMESLLVDSHAIRAISFSNNGKILSLGTNSKSLKLYDFSPINEKFLRHNNSSTEDFISLKLLFEKPNHHAGSIYCLDFSPNDKLIATGSNDKMIKIFVVPDFSSKTIEILELAIPDQHGTVRSVVFPPTDDNFFFSGGSGDKNVYMWDTETGKKINSLIGHEKDINSLKFSIDENSQIKLLGSCGTDKIACFHDYRTNNPVKKVLIENHGEINDITFSNDFFCTVHNDGYICLYNNINESIIKEYKVSNKELRAINFSKDGKFLMTASFDNKISIFDINDKMKLVKSLEHDDRAVNCKWHPDKPIIASSSADKTARIWMPKVY